jgi:O-antigen/teichoic acid export membrane protein
MAAHEGLRRILTNAGALAVGGVLAQIAFVFIEAVIARRIGLQAYGAFSVVYTITLLMVLAVDMGMNWKLIQDGSRDRRTIAPNLHSMIRLKIIAFAVAYPLILAGLVIGGADTSVYAFFSVFALFGLLMTLQDSLAAVYTSLQRNWFNALFQTATPVAILVAGAAIVLPAPSLTRTAVAYVAGNATIAALWMYITIRQFPAAAAAPRLSAARIREILAGSYQYGLNSLVSYFGLKSGILLLSLLSDPVQIALFAAAFKLLDLGHKAPVVAMRVFAPKLFADKVHRPAAFIASSDALMRFAGLSSAATAVILVVAGPPIIRLIFGEAFIAAGSLVQLLGVSLALKTFSLMAETVLTTGDQLAFRTRALLASTVLGVMVSVPLIMQWEAVGAALGVLVGDIVMLLLVLARLRSLLPTTGAILLAGIPFVASVVALLAARSLDAPAFYAAPLALVVLLALLLITGYLKPVGDLLSRNVR